MIQKENRDSSMLENILDLRNTLSNIQTMEFLKDKEISTTSQETISRNPNPTLRVIFYPIDQEHSQNNEEHLFNQIRLIFEKLPSPVQGPRIAATKRVT
ncbi:hypothetical protein RIF29_39289 [Crotalaria pallida]|uniref:Uncharacterized protein n=1 Tax=Crotalaria pallida TaxID=3830 RepID=A0AAN9E3D4_CROPI